MSRIAASADPFYAIADGTRRRMLDALCAGELTATALGTGANLAQPTVSKHLRVLRESGLVEVRRNGRERIYSLTPGRLRPVFDWMSHYQAFWPARLDSLRELLERADD